MKQHKIDDLFWSKELYSLHFGDKRLDDRFYSIMEKFSHHPGASINLSQGSWAESKAAYRLFENPKVTCEQILNAHINSLLKRCQTEKEIIVAEDTTFLIFTHLTQVEGLGPVSGFNHGKSKGLIVHTAEAMTLDGVPLGIFNQVIWSRNQPNEKDDMWFSESNKWDLCSRPITEQFKDRGINITYVCDREADIWILYKLIDQQGNYFVIRSKKIKDPLLHIRNKEKKPTYSCEIEENLDGQPMQNSIEIELIIRPIKPLVGYHIYRPSGKKEKIKLHISFLKMDMKKSVYFQRKDHSHNLNLWLVRAKEINPPSDREKVEWLLKTNKQVNTFEDAVKIVFQYKLRWEIEEFHKILKSGCKVEEARLGTVEKLKKYITAMSIVSWKIHYLKVIGRRRPDSDCTVVLTEDEWKTLYIKINKSTKFPKHPPSLHQAILWIGRLGGHLGRKSDGEPGVKSIWIGWQRLMDSVDVLRTILLNPQFVGKR